jgi:hypothetical protein
VKDIELHDQGMTTAILRELAGVRVRVPSNSGYPAEKQDELRARVRRMAEAIVNGPPLERSRGSLAASERWQP